MLFKNANIFVGGQFQHGSFRVENGRFAEILTTVPAEDGIDLENQYVIPGLVDVHNHGNSGADFSDGDYDGLVKMARYLAQNGVTSFAPASMTLPYDVLEAAYKTAVQLNRKSRKQISASGSCFICVMRLSLGCRCFVFYDQYNLGQMLLQPMLQVIFTFCIGIINKYYNVKLSNINKNSVCCS